jgi:hypothetical protein
VHGFRNTGNILNHCFLINHNEEWIDIMNNVFNNKYKKDLDREKKILKTYEYF